MASVTFDGTTRSYNPSDRPAVDQLDLEIADGEFLVLVGPSGCGKSTSLRMLAGLEKVDGGTIRIGDRDVTRVAPKDRDIAMVFQNYALYPHMTVSENMGFALRMSGVPKSETSARVLEAAQLLDLEPYLDRKPKALSGGQRQRVAMGRAIVRHPQVFLMDEPLSNLDAQLRVQTRTQIARLQRELGVTTVFVTHDQTEAMTMGDRVAVLKDGVLQQVGTPGDLYDRPSNAFVASFIGSPAMNLLNGQTTSTGVRVDDQVIEFPRALVTAADTLDDPSIIVGFRPEDLRRTVEGAGLAVTVDIVEVLGADAYVYGRVGGGDAEQHVIVRTDGRTPPGEGAVIHVTIAPGREHAFDPVSGRRLGSD